MRKTTVLEGLLLEILSDATSMSVRASSDGVVIGVATFSVGVDKKFEWHHFVFNFSTKLVEKVAEIMLSVDTVATQKLLISLKSVAGGTPQVEKLVKVPESSRHWIEYIDPCITRYSRFFA